VVITAAAMEVIPVASCATFSMVAPVIPAALAVLLPVAAHRDQAAALHPAVPVHPEVAALL